MELTKKQNRILSRALRDSENAEQATIAHYASHSDGLTQDERDNIISSCYERLLEVKSMRKQLNALYKTQ